MGIERFFKAVQENKITNLQSQFTKKLSDTKKINCTQLFIDFNSIIYTTSFKVISDLNDVLYKIVTGKTTDILVDEFIKMYDTAKVNSLVIQKVQQYVLNMIENYVNPIILNTVYVAIDGVPTLSKVVEQKKRRYINAVIAQYKKEIFTKHEHELKKNKVKYTYELNKLTFDRNSITPGTQFMNDLDSSLKSEQFMKSVKQLCPNLKQFVFSGSSEPGEGEMKIVDQLMTNDNQNQNQNQNQEKILVYSPDSDVPLLMLTVRSAVPETVIKRIKVLRYNQQKKNYDVVNVDKLANNIYNYVINKSKLTSKSDIIYDIVFLLTVFGNDFVPKVESYNVKSDFDKIIDIYTSLPEHIINFKLKTVNQQMFIRVVGELDKMSNLQKVYMEHNYLNYNKLKNIFHTNGENFTEVLQQFLDKLKKFDEDVVNNKINNLDKDFIQKLSKLTKFNVDSVVNNYYEYYKKHNVLPKVEVGLVRFSKLHNFKKIKFETEYDKELYMLENMLGDYEKMFRARPLNLGFITVDVENYVLKSEKISTSVANYYKDFFNKDPDQVVEKYVEGLMWLFQHYFNNFSIKENREIARLWYYPYSKAPLFREVHRFLKVKGVNPDYLNSLSKTVYYSKSNAVPMSNYFNSLEHFMYTAPAPLVMHLVPKAYHNFVKTSGFYDDLNLNSKPELDCRGVTFITKCELKSIKMQDVNEFITQIRDKKD